MVAHRSQPNGAARRSGLYALMGVGGATVSPSDAARLGLSLSAGYPAIAALGHDGQSPRYCHRAEASDGFALLVGRLADPAAMANRLGLAQDAPQAGIAREAWHRFGTDMPSELTGEWSFLHWSPARGCVLMLSAAVRDPLFYAQTAGRLSVAPDVFALSALPWVEGDLDECAMLAAIANGVVRQALAERTMFRQVKALLPGGSLIVSANGHMSKAQCRVLTPQPVSTRDPREAIAMYRETMLAVVRERMAGVPHCTNLLSGGLDSSLLAWAAAEVRGPDQRLSAITIVAPEGSNVPDERHFAAMVTRHLDIDQYHVSAHADLNQYRPADHILNSRNGIPQVGRHCTTESIQRTVQATGADMVINGMWGETSATSRHYALPLRTKVGRALRDLRARWTARAITQPVGPAFHARLAPHRLQAIAGEIDDALRAAAVSEAPSEKGRSETIGYLPAAYKCLHQPNEFYAGAARMESIFRDMRLLRLFASFPRDMLRRDLADRGLARAMLDGGLPDAIRLRADKGPAFPDNLQRMRREAPGARQRLPLFRSAELDDWLDLDWLDQQLGIIAVHGPANERHSVTVQTTAIAAEFLLWWRSNG